MKRITFELTLEVDSDVAASSVTHMNNHIDDAYDGEKLHMISLTDIVMTDIQNMDEDKEPHDFPQGPISWEDAAKIADTYELVLSREEKDSHEIVLDKHSTLRWVANPDRENEIMDSFGAKDLNDLFTKGVDKNDPIIRELYKCIGYSLYGFWEVFYWEVNNERANEYVAPIHITVDTDEM